MSKKKRQAIAEQQAIDWVEFCTLLSKWMSYQKPLGQKVREVVQGLLVDLKNVRPPDRFGDGGLRGGVSMTWEGKESVKSDRPNRSVSIEMFVSGHIRLVLQLRAGEPLDSRTFVAEGSDPELAAEIAVQFIRQLEMTDIPF